MDWIQNVIVDAKPYGLPLSLSGAAQLPFDRSLLCHVEEIVIH